MKSTITVLMAEPQKPAGVAEIGTSPEQFQQAVGGRIENKRKGGITMKNNFFP